MKNLINPGTMAIYEYICDNCNGTMDTEEHQYPIKLIFPYGHSHDSFEDNTIVCSDKCGIEFLKKSMKKFGAYQAQLVDKAK